MKVCPDCKQLYPDESSFCYAEGSGLEPMEDPRMGTLLSGRYVVGAKIGHGRFANVYRAEDQVSGRVFAAKVFHGPTGDPKFKEVPRRASMQVKRVPHPNLVDMLDDGALDDGAQYVVMEMLDGQKLSDLLKGGKLPVNRALRITADILRGLARAHDFAVVHWDIKPSNIFVLKSGVAKLRNFGLLRALEGTFGQAKPDYAWLTTHAYLAPERAGPFGDLYSVGCVLFEMLTGTTPYQADDAAAMTAKHRTEPVPSVAERIQVPASLDAFVQSLLGKSPAQRPVNANAALAQLTAIAQELSAPLPEPPVVEPAPATSAAMNKRQQEWESRINVFDEMVKRGFPAGAPPHVARSLEDMRKKVNEVGELRKQMVEHFQALDIIEQNGRESLLRLGETLSTIMTEAAAVLAEARAAQGAPSQDLAAQLADLDYQVKDLRSALNAEVQDLDERRSDHRGQIATTGNRAFELMSDVMATAPRFCAPLRANPQLAPLFSKLVPETGSRGRDY